MTNSRLNREIHSYESGLKRDLWRIFRQAGYHETQDQYKILLDEATHLNRSLRILELGSSKWKDFIYDNLGEFNIDCYSINISKEEILRSKDETLNLNLSWYPTWLEMDAHQLSFPDNHFDIIFGFGMLHHLDIPLLFNSLNRVLKPGGILFFKEPLDINPLLKIGRTLTPEARTSDETPFTFKELRYLSQLYPDHKFYYQQFFSFYFSPFLLIIPLFLRDWFSSFFYKLDRYILNFAPFLGPYFRQIFIVLRKAS